MGVYAVLPQDDGCMLSSPRSLNAHRSTALGTGRHGYGGHPWVLLHTVYDADRTGECFVPYARPR